MLKVFYVGLGGFLGSAMRYLVSVYSARLFGTQFPYGTLIVNVGGGFLIGLITGISLSTDLISPDLKLFLVTGIIGGFTTFSTFSNETAGLLAAGSYSLGVLNICLNLFLGLGGVALGGLIARLVAHA
ncbi:MAG TPA: fluoride efflux transporter CrcB [Ruminococcaceae bacterium]|nr:fluoride efflux transporter CrcB [Oscillospiraceae bacterium]